MDENKKQLTIAVALVVIAIAIAIIVSAIITFLAPIFGLEGAAVVFIFVCFIIGVELYRVDKDLKRREREFDEMCQRYREEHPEMF